MNTLRKLVCKGPKYWEGKAVDCTSAKSNILEDTDKCIRWGSHKKGLSDALLTQWKNMAHVLTSNIYPRKIYTSLRNKLVNDALKDLHDRYVITPINMVDGILWDGGSTFICPYEDTKITVNKLLGSSKCLKKKPEGKNLFSNKSDLLKTCLRKWSRKRKLKKVQISNQMSNFYLKENLSWSYHQLLIYNH